MQNIGALVYLVMFAIATVFLYLAVRRRWVSPGASLLLGCVVDPLLFIMYSLARGNVFIQALIVGLLVGLLFTVLTISIALFFRNNSGERPLGVTGQAPIVAPQGNQDRPKP